MGDSYDPQNEAEFDAYAGSYADMHASSVKASGEDPEYFGIYKQKFLERLLGKTPGPVLDFGCGIGNLTHLLVRSFDEVHGFDPSKKSVDVARTRAEKATFFDDKNTLPKDTYGAIVLANVLHHVPPPARKALVADLVPLLAKGGKVVIFEHNPLNPVTVKAVKDCPFDEDAVLLYPWEVTTLLDGAGLVARKLDYIVFFPRPLAKLRPLEPHLRGLPLGAQVCAWAERR
jgi:2-polyprenyl-3-methyl-5-hydroxy-6-metoxy-1,4-benzoquinol methylase